MIDDTWARIKVIDTRSKRQSARDYQYIHRNSVPYECTHMHPNAPKSHYVHHFQPSATPKVKNMPPICYNQKGHINRTS